MDDIKITTNNHKREVINAWELTKSEREQFDYLDWDAIDDGTDSTQFFRFRGEIWDIGEFEWTGGSGYRDSWLNLGWNGIQTQSYFDAIVIRYGYDDTGDAYVIVGHATW